MIQRKWKLITSGFISLFKTTKKSVNLPKSSDILRTYLKQRNLTSWTAFYVPRCEVIILLLIEDFLELQF